MNKVALVDLNAPMVLRAIIAASVDNVEFLTKNSSTFVRDYVYAWARDGENCRMLALKDGENVCCIYCINPYKVLGFIPWAVRVDAYFLTDKHIDESIGLILQDLRPARPGLIKMHYSLAPAVRAETASRQLAVTFDKW